MIFVYLLTETQKNDLLGVVLAPDTYFNPIQDFDDNWIISQEEVDQCINDSFIWVKTLPQIEYKPKNIE